MRCEAITRAGERCRLDALPGAAWCYGHDPRRASERSRNARKAGKTGGRGRPGSASELAEIKRDIRRVIAAVDSGETERGVGSVLGQLFNTLIRAVEVERRVSESDLEERIFALENTLTELVESEARWRA